MRLGTRRNSHKPFAILDIGSSKICCMIGEIDKLGTLSLIGQGTHASAGMRAGEVNVLSEFSDAIGNCVQSAERAAGLSITSVSVVMPGGRPHSAFGTQHMTLSDSTASRRDIRGCHGGWQCCPTVSCAVCQRQNVAGPPASRR